MICCIVPCKKEIQRSAFMRDWKLLVNLVKCEFFSIKNLIKKDHCCSCKNGLSKTTKVFSLFFHLYTRTFSILRKKKFLIRKTEYKMIQSFFLVWTYISNNLQTSIAVYISRGQQQINYTNANQTGTRTRR